MNSDDKLIDITCVGDAYRTYLNVQTGECIIDKNQSMADELIRELNHKRKGEKP